MLCGLALSWAASASVAGQEPTPARQDELLHRLQHDCGSCHGMTLKGGLGPALRPADLSDRPEADLVHIIRNGDPGTPMAPWGTEISNDEARWLIAVMKSGLDRHE